MNAAVFINELPDEKPPVNNVFDAHIIDWVVEKVLLEITGRVKRFKQVFDAIRSSRPSRES